MLADENRLLSPSDVADLLDVKTTTLEKWRESGRVDLPFVKLGANNSIMGALYKGFIVGAVLSAIALWPVTRGMTNARSGNPPVSRSGQRSARKKMPLPSPPCSNPSALRERPAASGMRPRSSGPLSLAVL